MNHFICSFTRETGRRLAVAIWSPQPFRHQHENTLFLQKWLGQFPGIVCISCASGYDAPVRHYLYQADLLFILCEQTSESLHTLLYLPCLRKKPYRIFLCNYRRDRFPGFNDIIRNYRIPRDHLLALPDIDQTVFHKRKLPQTNIVRDSSVTDYFSEKNLSSDSLFQFLYFIHPDPGACI